jgi:hypothetical protein
MVLATLPQSMPKTGMRRSPPNRWHRFESLVADGEMKRVDRRLKSASAAQGFGQSEAHVGLPFRTIPEVSNMVDARLIGVHRRHIVTCETGGSSLVSKRISALDLYQGNAELVLCVSQRQHRLLGWKSHRRDVRNGDESSSRLGVNG